jgi:hypothetical protein
MIGVCSTEFRITIVDLLLEKYNEIESEVDTIPDIKACSQMLLGSSRKAELP